MKEIFKIMKPGILLLFLFFQHTGFSQSGILIKENTLIPEGIAIDPRNGNIYISSIAKHKIVKVTHNNEVSDFIKEGDQGFLEGLGLKVDTKRNILWGLSNKRSGKSFTSQIHGFELNTAERKYYYSFQDTIPHLLNDLVLDSDGNLVITDTYFSSIYKFYPASQKLELYVKSPQIKYPNGLAFGKDQKLYVATYGTGLLQIDLQSKNIQPLSGFKDSAIAFGLDGLVYSAGRLYGIYNADTTQESNTIINYQLDEKKGKIVKETILDKGNPDFFDPTTAAFYKNKLYVIANSHLDKYNKNKESVYGIENLLRPAKILVYDLKE